mmetsp:Transcript_9026/g.16272  ORF Transcript_9026/g.16272 Transcript_9026/m.16272 type:complete len:113 (+) Transcript_9026:557-895(+)
MFLSSGCDKNERNDKFSQLQQTLFSASVSSILAAALTSPLDLFKTRFQLQSNSMNSTNVHVLKSQMKSEFLQMYLFPKSILKATAARILALTPAAIITISSFDLLHKFSTTS